MEDQQALFIAMLTLLAILAIAAGIMFSIDQDEDD